MSMLFKTSLLTISTCLLLPSFAYAENNSSPETPEWQNAVTIKDGRKYAPLKIGTTIYECEYDQTAKITVISDNIYNDNRRDIHVHRLGYEARKARGLHKNAGEFYLSNLPVSIGKTSLNLPNPIISKFDGDSGLCVGIGGTQTNANTRRQRCHFGVSVLISGTRHRAKTHWCVIGQDAVSTEPQTYLIESSTGS